MKRSERLIDAAYDAMTVSGDAAGRKRDVAKQATAAVLRALAYDIDTALLVHPDSIVPALRRIAAEIDGAA